MQALKVLVVVMGLAIAAMLAVIVVTVARRIGAGPAGGEGFGEVAVAVPEGCALAGIESAEGRLILRIDGPAERGCQQAVVLDPQNGRLLGRVTLAPGPRGDEEGRP